MYDDEDDQHLPKDDWHDVERGIRDHVHRHATFPAACSLAARTTSPAARPIVTFGEKA